MLDKEKGIIKLTKNSNENLSYLKDLDDEQIQPVKEIYGPVLVVAGAGSGKTRVLTYRVAHMINSGIKPSEILLLTFTNKSAEDMMKKVAMVASSNIDGLTGGTYHHVGNIMLRKYANLVGLKNNYTILDEEDSLTMMKMAKNSSEIDNTEIRLPSDAIIKEVLSLSINKQENIFNVLKQNYPHFLSIHNEISLIIDKYAFLKMQNNVIDFDDILVYWYKLLLEQEGIRNKYANEIYKYILVDEFQDTNFLQFEIIKLLSGKESNIMVVGDPNQSIYKWRGAEIDNILNFPNFFKNCKVFSVSYNYRSTPEILNLANDSIKNNHKKSSVNLKSKGLPGEKPYVINCPTVEDEASFVAQWILQLHNDQGVELKRIGVLYRSHYMVKDLEVELTARGVPYDIRSGVRFFEQKHIKDVVAFVRLINNPYDEISWNRTIQQLEGIGGKTTQSIIENLVSKNDIFDYLENEVEYKYIKRKKDVWIDFVNKIKFIYKNRSTSEIINYFLKNHYENYIKYKFENFKDRIRDVESLIEYSSKYNDITKFLEEITLMDNIIGESKKKTDSQDKDKDKITLTTIHKAKGLEWDYVFVIGCSEGRFPNNPSLKDIEEFEEERRLFYVALTRAKLELYLSFPSRYLNFEYKSYIYVQPSEFIQELNRTLYEYFNVQ